MIRVLYPCDPEKNKECTKEACGLMCNMTTDPTYAKDNWVFEDLKIIPSEHIELADVIFLNVLKRESEEHEKKRKNC